MMKNCFSEGFIIILITSIKEFDLWLKQVRTHFSISGSRFLSSVIGFSYHINHNNRRETNRKLFFVQKMTHSPFNTIAWIDYWCFLRTQEDQIFGQGQYIYYCFIAKVESSFLSFISSNTGWSKKRTPPPVPRWKSSRKTEYSIFKYNLFKYYLENFVKILQN